jgi:hypothetical protein
MGKGKDIKPEAAEEKKVLSTEEVIIQVLDGYLKQEMGNKVSQFSVQGLMTLMLMAIEQNSKQED